MSHEPEDSLLEEALRSDLPSADTEARLRRRLLAAGVAVGNGMAVTTAAAGTATTSAAATGFVAKVVGLSWGVKLGLAAAVTIPTVGLMLDRQAAHRQSVQTPAIVVPAETPRAVAADRAPIAPGVAQPQAAERSALPEAERAVVRAQKPAVAEAPAAAARDELGGAHPSQGDFGAPEAPARAPQAASTLADETRLLDGAFAALAAGNQRRAAQLIGEHESRYPQGLLTKERERAKIRLSELSRGE